MKPVRLPAQLYRQFDADPALKVPGEGYGGWHTVEAELAPKHTALVVMHAWDCGQPHEFPGWRRAVEYTPRAEKIMAEVFPPLLAAVRKSPLPVFHVVGGDRDYWSHLPGYQQTALLVRDTPPAPLVPRDTVFDHMQQLRRAQGSPGEHNTPDVNAGFARLDFAPTARPVGDEAIAKDGTQLAALCRAHGINHLIYVGFAINWCLLMSPGGMVDMARHGCLCSTIREATTAVENRETARQELEKAQALWRVALEFGFVFSLEDFLSALRRGG
ncbi:MAG: isochorismatase family protein [Opitutaceae bacterium]|nr:isochorismatase family protein [Opitutaceae bacterium]